MTALAPLFLSSGDLIADRRYEQAMALAARGDLDAAADLLAQTVERAPAFGSAWFALGDIRERLEDHEGAREAFRRALDPEDRHGAGLRLARLGAAQPASAMVAGYVRALFDQHAPDFDRALVDGLGYRGPQVLREAVLATGQMRFRRALDLGCGTGLVGEAFAACVDVLVGVDLSPRMIEIARRKGVYNALHVADMQDFLAQASEAADLVIAADALVYVADLAPVARQVARILGPEGLFAFTVETHDADGVVLGASLRYAHGAGHVRAAIAAADLDLITLDPASTRSEGGVAVPGLVAVARRR